MSEPLAYLDGEFIRPASDARIPLDDLGFMLGTTVTEQLRTFAGRLFHLEDHLRRLEHSLRIVGLSDEVPVAPLAAVAEELVTANHRLLDAGDDLGLTMFVTPGAAPTLNDGAYGPPRVGLHTFPLAFHRWADKYERGEALVVTNVRQVSPDCWPPELKCRSRMHYYLADREAAARQPGARALLLDALGQVTETTTANLLLFRGDEGLVSPPHSAVLPGISLSMVRGLAASQQIAWQERALVPADVQAADEVMLTSTPFCLLPVTSLDGRPIGRGQPGPVFRQLLAAWSQQVGVDIAAQAARFARRPDRG